MRHGRAGFKLGRLTAHRWAMFRNLLVALFRHERIVTTEVFEAMPGDGVLDVVGSAERADVERRVLAGRRRATGRRS